MQCTDVLVEDEHSDDSEFPDGSFIYIHGLVHLSMNKLPSPDYFTCQTITDNVGPLRKSSRCHSPLHMLATFSPTAKNACRNSILATCSAVHALTKRLDGTRTRTTREAVKSDRESVNRVPSPTDLHDRQ